MSASRASPLVLLLPCLAGMGAGLWWDARNVLPEALVALCTTGEFGVRIVARDWSLMPAAHAGMWAAALAAIAWYEWRATSTHRVGRLCTHAACLGAMSLGMSLGGWLAAQVSVALGLPALPALALAMAGGMALGVAPAVRLAGR